MMMLPFFFILFDLKKTLEGFTAPECWQFSCLAVIDIICLLLSRLINTKILCTMDKIYDEEFNTFLIEDNAQ